MAAGKITNKQLEILNYIKDEILKRGYPPTVREICETVHLKSTSSVHSHLETLEKMDIFGEILPSLVPSKSAMTASRWFVRKWSAFLLSAMLLPVSPSLPRRIFRNIFPFLLTGFHAVTPLC